MNIDTTQPHIGRIYDYVLGGHHNYEADRKAAEELLKLVPSYPTGARLNRWFLQFVANRWAEEGRARVLDLASGLPTQGHFNDYLPEASILFSDSDPLSVAYGQQVLEAHKNAKYVEADVRAPDGLLREAAAFFGADRRLAVGAIGILYFLSELELTRLMQRLHAFCAAGSVLALSFVHVRAGKEQAFHDTSRKFQEQAGVTVYRRTPEQMAELIKPWRMSVYRNAEEWLKVPEMLEGSDMPASLVGALAEH